MSRVVKYRCDSCELQSATMTSDRLPPDWFEVYISVRKNDEHTGKTKLQYLCPKCGHAEKYMYRQGFFGLMDLMATMLIARKDLE